MDLVTIIILALATWRLSHMLCLENGPAQIFQRIRARAGVIETNLGVRKATALPGEILLCLNCTSIWIAVALTALWLQIDISRVVIAILAVSGGACLAHKGVSK